MLGIGVIIIIINRREWDVSIEQLENIAGFLNRLQRLNSRSLLKFNSWSELSYDQGVCMEDAAHWRQSRVVTRTKCSHGFKQSCCSLVSSPNWLLGFAHSYSSHVPTSATTNVLFALLHSYGCLLVLQILHGYLLPLPTGYSVVSLQKICKLQLLQ